MRASGPGAGGARVIPIGRGTVQLVRPLIGGEDPYQAYLDRLPEIQPGEAGSHLLGGLVPNEEELSGLAEMAAPIAVDPHTQAHEDPAMDAFGGRGVKSVQNKPLGGDGGGAAS